MKINSKILGNLGFEKTHVPAEQSGDYDFEYWTLDLSKSNYNFCLISEESTTVKNDAWYVEIFEVPEYRFTDAETLTNFIETLKKVKYEDTDARNDSLDKNESANGFGSFSKDRI